MRWRRSFFGIGLASMMALPAMALAQDADADGVQDAADAFPCDGSRASVTYFPGQSTSALLAFEDQWPSITDLDFNDVAVRVHHRLERNAAGDVVRLVAVIDPVALGGEFSNGLGLQLPASRAGVSVRRRVDGGAWAPLALEGDASATVVLSANLRELYGSVAGPINALQGAARLDGARLEVEVSFATPAPLSLAEAPFDLFVFRADDPGHQIHFPQYAGTAAMNGALFGSGQDGSTPSRRFVHLSGVPAALNLMTSTRYPHEGTRIPALFPDILRFAASGGVEAAAFYSSDVVVAQGHDVPARALPPEDAPDLACKAIGTTAATAGATCRTIQVGGGTSSGIYWIDPDGAGGDAPYQVFCDQITDGGGWTVFQRRTSGAVDFYRTYAEYQAGFGSPATEYWVGLDRIHRFTAIRPSRLRVDLQRGASSAYAAYRTFSISPASEGHWLNAGLYSGTAGDSLTYHSGARFSTRDAGNAGCAQAYLGAWWYRGCHYSNLNGTWGLTTYAQGPVWFHWLGYYTPMTFTQMAMREN